LLLAVCLLEGSLVAGQPVRPETAGPGYVPPVPLGILGDGRARHASQPLPFPAVDEQWVTLRTPHFTVVSSAGQKRTRETARNLETLAAALAQVHPRFKPTAPAPTRVILFGRREESQPWFDAMLNREHAQASGIFVSQKESASMLVDASSRDRSDRTPYHELIHYLLAGGGVRPPLWLEEGLAEYFSSAEIHDGAIWVGGSIPEHIQLLRGRKVMPLRELFSAQYESEVAARPSFYAESWALVDWMLRTKRSAFYDFLHDVESGTTAEAALRKHYGRGLDEIERSLIFVAGSSHPTYASRIAVNDVPSLGEPVLLSRADLLVELGRFLSSIDGLTAEAERHFRAALAAEPKHGRALAGLGSLRAAERKYAEAEPFFAQAIEADPRDPELALLYAEALLQNEIGPFAETDELPGDAAPRLHHAREVAQRALTLICGDCTAGDASRSALAGRAYGDLGTSYLADADFRPGISLLERAHELLPARHDYTLHLLALDRRAGQQARAEALFAGLAGAHNAQLAFAARSVVVREELQRANALIREQKLDEGVKVLRALAAESPDPDARADLERQAADVARVAATNREIFLYNRAIGEANSGKRSAAIKTLEELLRVAKDPQVIADATKLRTQLAKRHG